MSSPPSNGTPRPTSRSGSTSTTVQPLAQHVDDRPAVIGVPGEPLERSKRNARDLVEHATANELGEIPIDLTDADVPGVFEQDDRSGEVGTVGAHPSGQLAQVPSDERTAGSAIDLKRS